MTGKALDPLRHSEICVAFAALSLAGFAQIRMTGTFDPTLVAAVGCGVFFGYTLERRLTLKTGGNPFLAPKLEWQENNRRAVSVSLAASLAGGLYLLFRVDPRPLSLAALLAAILIFLAYSFLETASGGKFKIRLKAGFLTKNLSLIAAWLLTTVFFPFAESENAFGDAERQLVFFTFTWLLSNTLIFDLRDRLADARGKIKTFPVVFGRFFSLVLLFAFNFAALMTFMGGRKEYGFDEFALVAPNILYSLTALYLIAYRSRANPGFYLFADLILAIPFLQSLAAR